MNKVSINKTNKSNAPKHGQYYVRQGEVFLMGKFHENGTPMYVLIGLDDGYYWDNPNPDINKAFGTETDWELVTETITITLEV